MKLAVADLFLVGTALDLVGGVLIAKGLLISLDVLAVRATTFWGGNPTVAVGAVEDRVDARFGLSTLAIGFTLQGTGYFVSLAAEPPISASLARALTAFGLAAFATVTVVIAWRLVRPRMIHRDLVLLARLEIKDVSQGPSQRQLPELGALAAYGRAWKGPRSRLNGLQAEIDRDDVRLIFGDVETRSEDHVEAG
jgi:hypothetical protein